MSMSSSGSNVDGKKDNSVVNSPSALTMRFIPLIECFLTICNSTLLIRPTLSSDQSSSSTGYTHLYTFLMNLIGGEKRKLGLTTPKGETSHQQNQFKFEVGSPYSMTRSSSLLPGSRFRQNNEYMQMQMGIFKIFILAILYNFNYI